MPTVRLPLDTRNPVNEPHLENRPDDRSVMDRSIGSSGLGAKTGDSPLRPAIVAKTFPKLGTRYFQIPLLPPGLGRRLHHVQRLPCHRVAQQPIHETLREGWGNMGRSQRPRGIARRQNQPRTTSHRYASATFLGNNCALIGPLGCVSLSATSKGPGLQGCWAVWGCLRPRVSGQLAERVLF